MESNEHMRNPRSEITVLRDQDSVAIHLSFEVSDQLSENIVLDTEVLVRLFLPNVTYSLEVQGFQPSSKCLFILYEHVATCTLHMFCKIVCCKVWMLSLI